MARKKIDWEAVEKDYRTGAFTLRELADKHGCSNAGVAKKAKEQGWKKDLSKAIKQRTKSRAVELATGKTDDKEIVEAAAEEGAKVLAKHKGKIAEWQGRTVKYAEVIDSVLKDKEDAKKRVRDLGTSINAGTQSLHRLIQMERQAHGLDDDDGDTAGKTLEELLAQVAG